MRRSLVPVLVLAVLSVPAVSLAQSTFFGPEVGIFYPSSGELRDAIGSSWISFGVGKLNLQDYSHTKLSPNFNVISGDSNGSKVFMATYTLGIVQPMRTGGGKSDWMPYVAYRAGLSYVDYAVNTNGSRVSGKQLGYDANAEVGVLFGNRLSLSARYDFISGHDGLDFNGLSLSLRYGVAKF